MSYGPVAKSSDDEIATALMSYGWVGPAYEIVIFAMAYGRVDKASAFDDQP